MFDCFDPRWPEERDRDESSDRNRGSRGGTSDAPDLRERDPRDAFVRDLNLPRGPEREIVRDRHRTYALNGSESRALAATGAFRVVRAEDLHAGFDRDGSRRVARDPLRHLRESGLIERTRLDSRHEVVTLTTRGRDLLEASRHDRGHETRQAFYAGVRKPRELTHDSQVYRAYLRAEARLRGEGARIERVVLDYELKRDYQSFLQARNKGREDSDGRPDRTPEEIQLWAYQHHLPYEDEHVEFPDCRVEYEDRDGRSREEDLEIVTPHYRGAHAAGAVKSGFTCYAIGFRTIEGRRGGRPFDPRVADEFFE